MGWVIIIFICIVIIFFFILSTSSRRHGKKTMSRRATVVVPPKRPSKEIEIRRLLNLAYTTNQRLTMRYETSNPLPGEPAIKIRNVDVYGLSNEHGYFDAYCHYRGEVRTFKISRIIWARLINEKYSIPRSYNPSGWVTEGWAEIEDGKLESIEETCSESTTLPKLPMLKDVRSKHKPHEQRRDSRGIVPNAPIGEDTETYVRYDWQRHFEKSILTPFPEEWSPALPYLHEAHRLEEAGADQEKIQEVLETARQVDKDATAFYIGRLSIIRKVQSQRLRERQKE